MRRRVFSALLCLLLLPALAGAAEGAFLTGEDLQQIKPAYEAFLQELADVLEARGLLLPSEREAWILYQLGDLMQNGGYGSIVAMYTPGLLSLADESVAMRRLTLKTDVGTLRLDTLAQYKPSLSQLPGLPLDAEVVGLDGTAVECRFHWTASEGSLYLWDGARGEIVEVGATFITKGSPLYWAEEPIEGVAAELTLTLLHPTEDTALAKATLILRSDADGWIAEGFQ